MSQLYVTTAVIRNMMQHYVFCASGFTVFVIRCQAGLLSADNKRKMPYLADESATVRYVGNKVLHKKSSGQHLHI